ncbi:MAG TPA: hypothetical protein VGO00_22205, partial [Kofleriaceae bacterium]|nr:hypothetical protein [Kofleriaceae bacterium]
MHRIAVVIAIVACGNKQPARDDAATATPADATRKGADASITPDAGVARIEHGVFKLVDNRHAAHRAVDGDFVIDAGDIGFARYTRFGLPVARWHLGRLVKGERAATADALASIEVP